MPSAAVPGEARKVISVGENATTEIDSTIPRKGHKQGSEPTLTGMAWDVNLDLEPNGQKQARSASGLALSDVLEMFPNNHEFPFGCNHSVHSRT